MTYYEAKIAVETSLDLNQITSAIHAGLYAADIDALGVTVQEFDSKPVFDVADYDEEITLSGEVINTHPTVDSLVEALKESGDRYNG